MKHMGICRKPRESTITLGRAAGFPHAKRSVTNPTVRFDHVSWVNLTFFLWRSQEIHSLAQSLNNPFTHSLAQAEKRTGECVCPSGLGRVSCAAGIVTGTSTAIVELTPNKSATTQVAKLNCFADRLSHSVYIIGTI